SHFEVQRSFNGKLFETIGEVKAAGNSSQILQYTFSDENATVLASKTLYYRLKQTDHDGRFEYSNLISLSRKPEIAAISVFPNPFSTSLTLKLNAFSNSGKCSIELLTLEGKTLYKTEEKVGEGQRLLEITNLSAIPSG